MELMPPGRPSQVAKLANYYTLSRFLLSIMINIKNSGLAVLLTIVTTAGASASTVTNSYYNETSTGTRSLDVVKVRSEVGSVNKVDQAIKCETFGGDFNSCNVNFDGNKITGHGTSFNAVPVDPVAIIGTTKTVTDSSFEDLTRTNFSEDSSFIGTTYTHSVSAE